MLKATTISKVYALCPGLNSFRRVRRRRMANARIIVLDKKFSTQFRRVLARKCAELSGINKLTNSQVEFKLRLAIWGTSKRRRQRCERLHGSSQSSHSHPILQTFISVNHLSSTLIRYDQLFQVRKFFLKRSMIMLIVWHVLLEVNLVQMNTIQFRSVKVINHLLIAHFIHLVALASLSKK